MIRRQRKAHVQVWTGIAVLVPLALAVILALSPAPVHERPPVRLDPPAAGGGG